MPKRTNWSVAVVLAAADSTKVIKASPGAGSRLVVTKLLIVCATSAAQAVDIESGDGAVEIVTLPASFAAGATITFSGEEGVPLPPNTTLRAQPAAAGPKLSIVAEGYVEFTGPAPIANP